MSDRLRHGIATISREDTNLPGVLRSSLLRELTDHEWRILIPRKRDRTGWEIVGSRQIKK